MRFKCDFPWLRKQYQILLFYFFFVTEDCLICLSFFLACAFNYNSWSVYNLSLIGRLKSWNKMIYFTQMCIVMICSSCRLVPFIFSVLGIPKAFVRHVENVEVFMLFYLFIFLFLIVLLLSFKKTIIKNLLNLPKLLFLFFF